MSYQSYLQQQAAQGGLVGREANALLKAGMYDGSGLGKNAAANVLTNGIGGITGNYGLAQNIGYNDKGHIESGGYGYGASGLDALNKKYLSQYNPKGNEDNQVYSSYGGGTGGASYNSDDMAYLNDQESRLKRQLESASRMKDNGLTSLRDSYSSEQSGANRQRSRALEDFSLKREDTTRGKDKALTKVDTNARTLAESLRRRIGLASGSGSSAYQITAPGAVARDASQDRTGVVENYGVNFRNLAQSEDRAKSDFEEYLQNLRKKFKQRKSDFLAGIYEQQNDISGSLSEVARQRALLQGGGYDQVKSAMSPYVSQIDSRQNKIDGLFEKYRTPYNVEKVKVNTPQLRDYLVDNATIQSQQAAGDTYSPYNLPPQEEDELATLY